MRDDTTRHLPDARAGPGKGQLVIDSRHRSGAWARPSQSREWARSTETAWTVVYPRQSRAAAGE
jgi:hypothetical protein